jgi:hypothetical protein
MGRPRTDAWYRAQVATLAAEGHKGPSIIRLIQEDAELHKRDDLPSDRKIYELLQEWRNLPAEERSQQGLFRWPDAMINDSLPWEAGRAGLDLLRWHDRLGVRRPTIRHVKWFWRLTLAAPGIPLPEANYVSAALAANEYLENTGSNQLQIADLDRRLAYQPWKGERELATYREASMQNGISPTDTWDISGGYASMKKEWLELAEGKDTR